MSISKILLQEQENFFKLSYSLSPDKFPYLQDQMEKHLPNLKIVERGNTTYGFFENSDDALFKFDWERHVMNSDYTYRELSTLRPKDLNDEKTSE